MWSPVFNQSDVIFTPTKMLQVSATLLRTRSSAYTHYEHCTVKCIWKRSNLVCDCTNWNSLRTMVTVYGHRPTSTHFHLLFCWSLKWLRFWFVKYQFACLPAMFLSPVHPHLCPNHNTRHSLAEAPWYHTVYAFTLSSLCWLLACCLFLFLLSVFSCTVLHWGGPLHPLPIPVCSPRTLSPCVHSVSCVITPSSHLSSHSLAMLDWFWLLWAEIFQ